jgi:hypothetical protein
MDKDAKINGKDIPVSKLKPLNTRKMGKRAHTKFLASLKTVGLVEPLCVYPGGTPLRLS